MQFMVFLYHESPLFQCLFNFLGLFETSFAPQTEKFTLQKTPHFQVKAA
jgi:hypothetical protein